MMARRLARTVLAAHLCTSARAWETIAGLKTQRMTVTPAPEGSPTIAKGDTIHGARHGHRQRNRQEVLEHEGPGPATLHLQRGRRLCITCVDIKFRASHPSAAMLHGCVCAMAWRFPRHRRDVVAATASVRCTSNSLVDFHSGDYGLGPGASARPSARSASSTSRPKRATARAASRPGGFPERRPLLRDRSALDQGQVRGHVRGLGRRNHVTTVDRASRRPGPPSATSPPGREVLPTYEVRITTSTRNRRALSRYIIIELPDKRHGTHTPSAAADIFVAGRKSSETAAGSSRPRPAEISEGTSNQIDTLSLSWRHVYAPVQSSTGVVASISLPERHAHLDFSPLLVNRTCPPKTFWGHSICPFT